MDEEFPAGTKIYTPLQFPQPKWECPVHGIHDHWIASSIVGHEGRWCQTCAIDMLDQLGVCRMKEIGFGESP